MSDVTQNFDSCIKGFGAEEGFQPLHENRLVRGVTSFKAQFYGSHLFVFEVWLMFKWNSSRYMFDLLIDVLSFILETRARKGVQMNLETSFYGNIEEMGSRIETSTLFS